MGDAQTTDVESAKPSPGDESQPEEVRPPHYLLIVNL